MKFTTDNIEWTTSMKDFADVTLSKKLERLSDDIANCELKLTKFKFEDKVKVEVSLLGFRAQAVHEDFYAAMVEAASKLKSIIARTKKKMAQIDNYQQLSVFESAIDQSEDACYTESYSNIVSKEKEFDLTPMTLAEAAAMFDCTDYPFFVYKDVDDNNHIAVIYKRHGNTLGLIRCH